VCAAGERFIAAASAVIIEDVPRDFGGTFTLRARCERCGRESARGALVKDARTAGVWRMFLSAT
jgi:hypothetical protein